MTSPSEDLQQQWAKLSGEFAALDELHKEYRTKIDEIKVLQFKCQSSIKNQTNQLKQVNAALKIAIAEEEIKHDVIDDGCGSDRVTPDNEKDELSEEITGESEKVKSGEESDADALKKIKEELMLRKNEIREMEEVLPKENGLYLRIILGTVNVSLLSKADKYAYKNDYELFKIKVTSIVFVLSLLILTVLKYRFWDTLLTFLLVWYYCTLTIRENILIINGSRVKGWWVTHHFVSTAVSGVLLVWPDGTTYQVFRTQFIVFVLYLSFVQFLQYYYQRGCLYRLRALGERHNMDLTAEGFQSWMWKGLTFLLPFLFVAYVFQLYNAYFLLRLSLDYNCDEWQVPLLSFLFLVLFLGNVGTTLLVIKKKFRLGESHFAILRNKYKME